MSDLYAHLPMRQGIGICLFNKHGEVFVGERIGTPDAWQMPQGGIHEGEDITCAAFREMMEEIGTDKAEILRIASEKIAYNLPEELITTLWGGSKFRGQEQTWIAMRFTGEDTDIKLDADEHPEFIKWQWLKLEETIDYIVPFKRSVYEQLISLFADIPASL